MCRLRHINQGQISTFLEVFCDVIIGNVILSNLNRLTGCCPWIRHLVMGNVQHSQPRDEGEIERQVAPRDIIADDVRRARRENDERRPNGDGNNTIARWHARRQEMAFYRKERYEEGERAPRILPSIGYTKFWESPFESKPYVEPKIFPIIWPHGLSDTEEDTPDSFPRFLNPFLNRDLRLFIKMDGVSNGPRTLETYPEAEILMRNFRYIKIKFMHHPLSDGIRVSVEENHGTKRKRDSRFRPMYPNVIIPNHVGQMIYILGEEFSLLLKAPHAGDDATLFPDGNGEVPGIVGTYLREMDTNPNIFIEWKVSLYKWYNQTEGFRLR